MKLISKVFLIFSWVSLSVLPLQAKSLEFLFDHTTTTSVDLKTSLEDLYKDQEKKKTPSNAFDTGGRLKIENIGDKPVKNCFPFTDHPPFTSLDRLASELATKRFPLLALYQLWDKSLIQEEKMGLSVKKNSCHPHPLDLLNFGVICSQQTFKTEFNKLCQALGIEMRLVNAQGRTLYDFYVDNQWSLLDLENQRFYLDLDNETLVSSEEVMDDPFLLLRTKHLPKNQPMNLAQGWQELAHFDILKPTPAKSATFPLSDWIERAEGFDLYPSERAYIDCHHGGCFIGQTLNLEARQVPLLWKYLSFFPIKEIRNQSSQPIHVNHKITILPGKLVYFQEENLFELTISFPDSPKGELIITGCGAIHLFPFLTEENKQIQLGMEENPSIVRVCYDFPDLWCSGEEKWPKPKVDILNEHSIFDDHSPYFLLGGSDPSPAPELIWWQIALDRDFECIPPNFDQIESFTSSLTLPLISETFLNPDQTYYFRVKGCLSREWGEQWGEWSPPYSFTVQKPLAVEQVDFDRIEQGGYELNWERYAEESSEPIEYLIFGSNSLDFIPSIYCDKQVNAIGSTGTITHEETNDNLVAITTNCKISISGDLAYYRIIARRQGCLSNPSRLIHIYDQDLIQPRNVLQVVEEEKGYVAKRTLFPPAYPWSESPLPQMSQEIKPERTKTENLIKIYQDLIEMACLRAKSLQHPYEFPDVSEEIWSEVRPFLLPSNHPAWSKLNRVFCQTRATLDEQSFRRAGFKRWRPGRWSRVSASSHPEFKEYFVKCYCDCERGIIYDWKKWIHRIEGAECIRQCIKDYGLKEHFKVPHKWIYPLPKSPAPPQNPRYVRKNFILVCEHMRILEHDKNEKMYKRKMNPELLKALYIILQTCGLYDSVYSFNCPFCKDGRIAIIDCEYHHKWPVPFDRLTKCFSKENRKYWKKLTHQGGQIPAGKNQANPPRMDRRDVPR